MNPTPQSLRHAHFYNDIPNTSLSVPPLFDASFPERNSAFCTATKIAPKLLIISICGEKYRDKEAKNRSAV